MILYLSYLFIFSFTVGLGLFGALNQYGLPHAVPYSTSSFHIVNTIIAICSSEVALSLSAEQSLFISHHQEA